MQGEYEYEIDDVEGTVPASLIGGRGLHLSTSQLNLSRF